MEIRRYKVKANKQQLKSIGIDYDITGSIGILIQKYVTGWYQIEVIHGDSITYVVDIPKSFLEEIKTIKTE